MQTRRIRTLTEPWTEPLTAKIRTSSFGSSGRTPVPSRARTPCVEACVSETKLGQSMSKDPAINRRTDEFCMWVFGAGRGRVRRVVLVSCDW